MPIDLTSKQLLTRRAIIAGAGSITVTAALAARLYYLQLVAADRYKTLAEDNRIKLQLLAPQRGEITDRGGVKLVTNRPNFRLLLEADWRQDSEQIIKQLSSYLAIGEKQRRQIREHMKSSRYPSPLLIAEHLDWETVAALEFHKSELPGLFIDIGQERYYPLGEYAAHLLGHVGAVTKDELEDRSLLRLPGFKTGKEGVEKSMEKSLRGKPGVRQMEVNVHGLAIRQVQQSDSVAGETIRLSVDAELQKFTSARFGKESGAAIVLDATNGNVLALTSMPAYDPNKFSRGISSKYWKELNSDERHPLLNKAIAGQYPPGSTFKMIVGLAALAENAVRPAEKIHCPGHFYLGNHRFNCWKAGGHGYMDLHHAIAHSCDTYFYTMAERLGIKPIAAMAREFGLGMVTGLELGGEKAGLIPSDEWKRRVYGDGWRTGDTVNAGIGQGYVLATPLQLAVMTARIASGKGISPQLFLQPAATMAETAAAKESDTVTAQRMQVNPDHLTIIRNAMNAVTNHPYGTAFYRRIKEPAMAMAGKTGTSQVRRIKIHGVKQSKLPWKYRHHALFVGYAPADAPLYAAAVIVEHGGGGASAAAPVARDILLKAQKLEIL